MMKIFGKFWGSRKNNKKIIFTAFIWVYLFIFQAYAQNSMYPIGRCFPVAPKVIDIGSFMQGVGTRFMIPASLSLKPVVMPAMSTVPATIGQLLAAATIGSFIPSSAMVQQMDSPDFSKSIFQTSLRALSSANLFLNDGSSNGNIPQFNAVGVQSTINSMYKLNENSSPQSIIGTLLGSVLQKGPSSNGAVEKALLNLGSILNTISVEHKDLLQEAVQARLNICQIQDKISQTLNAIKDGHYGVFGEGSDGSSFHLKATGELTASSDAKKIVIFKEPDSDQASLIIMLDNNNEVHVEVVMTTETGEYAGSMWLNFGPYDDSTTYDKGNEVFNSQYYTSSEIKKGLITLSQTITPSLPLESLSQKYTDGAIKNAVDEFYKLNPQYSEDINILLRNVVAETRRFVALDDTTFKSTQPNTVIEALGKFNAAVYKVFRFYMHPVQIIASYLLAGGGSILNIDTGEGKTIDGAGAAYLNKAIYNKGTNIITSGQILVKQNEKEVSPILALLGMSVGTLLPGDKVNSAAVPDLLYETVSTGRHLTMNWDAKTKTVKDALTKGRICIIDEIDEVSRHMLNPHIIAQSTDVKLGKREIGELEIYAEYADMLGNQKSPQESFNWLVTELGAKGFTLNAQKVSNAVVARRYERNADYMISPGKELVLIGPSGDPLKNHRLMAGLHQAVEVREYMNKNITSVSQDADIYNVDVLSRYIDEFDGLSGMSGTALAVLPFLTYRFSQFGLSGYILPRNDENKRVDTIHIRDSGTQIDTIRALIADKTSRGLSVLIGMHSLKGLQDMAKALNLEEDISLRKVSVLSAEDILAGEALDKIAMFGAAGDRMFITQVGGRGADYQPGTGSSGVAVITGEYVPFYHLLQLFGRAARGGAYGEADLVISVDAGNVGGLQDYVGQDIRLAEPLNMFTKYGVAKDGKGDGALAVLNEQAGKEIAELNKSLIQNEYRLNTMAERVDIFKEAFKDPLAFVGRASNSVDNEALKSIVWVAFYDLINKPGSDFITVLNSYTTKQIREWLKSVITANISEE